MKRLCNIFNYPSHYRRSIYKLMDEEFDCKFLFGDEKSDIKTLDISEFKDASYYHVINMGHFLITNGIIPSLFKNYDYYVLTISTNNLSHWLFFLLAKLFRSKKVYVWGHGMYGYESKGQMLVRKMYFGLVDGIITYGDYAKKIMVEAGFNADKIKPIHNSLDYNEQLRIRRMLKPSDVYSQHFNNQNPTLLFIGRLTKVKRLDQLIKAVSILKKRGEEYNIVFVGDGEQRNQLTSMVSECQLERNTWFYGACYDEFTNASLIYNADLCVSPGNVGLTSIHCFSFGTPVATHNHFSKQMPEFEVIKEGETGCFFEMDNINSMADSISNWFKSNKSLRNNVREQCYRIIDNEWNPNYQIEVLKRFLR